MVQRYNIFGRNTNRPPPLLMESCGSVGSATEKSGCAAATATDIALLDTSLISLANVFPNLRVVVFSNKDLLTRFHSFSNFLTFLCCSVSLNC